MFIPVKAPTTAPPSIAVEYEKTPSEAAKPPINSTKQIQIFQNPNQAFS
jgi:hypothetical protein